MISKSGGAVISERKNAKDRNGDCLTLSGFDRSGKALFDVTRK